tara:strand:- start:392 stop:628 length:237 start_codon:yes stop_codon:yes gene_type:complete
MSNFNASKVYLQTIKGIVDKNSVASQKTAKEKPSKFSGGGLMGNGKGNDDTKEQPYYEAHEQAFLDVARYRKGLSKDG